MPESTSSRTWRTIVWTTVKSVAAVFAFMTGLWTFHWNIDATLQKHEHDVLSELFQRLERRLTTKEADVSSRPLLSLVTALQASREAHWGVSIHELLAHKYSFTKWFFHPEKWKPLRSLFGWFKLKPDKEMIRLKAYSRYRDAAREQSFVGAKDSLLNPKRAGRADDPVTFLMIDTVVGAGIYLGKYKDKDGTLAAEELLKEARQKGSSANVVKALEAFRVEVSAGYEILKPKRSKAVRSDQAHQTDY